jgi:hypothetical protein
MMFEYNSVVGDASWVPKKYIQEMAVHGVLEMKRNRSKDGEP